MTKTPVNSIEELLAILDKPYRPFCDFSIQLSSGFFSRKEIALNEDGSLFILNCIDGTFQNLTPEELFDPTLTNIGRAMNNNAVYHLNYDN